MGSSRWRWPCSDPNGCAPWGYEISGVQPMIRQLGGATIVLPFRLRSAGVRMMNEQGVGGNDQIADPPALPLEYELANGHARRELQLSDVVNNPDGSGVVRVFRGLLKEQRGDVFLVE